MFEITEDLIKMELRITIAGELYKRGEKLFGNACEIAS